MKKYLLTALLALTALAAAQDTTPATTPAPAQTDTAPAQTPTDTTGTAETTAAPETSDVDPTTVVATVGSTDYSLAEFDRAFRMAVARSANSQGMPYSSDMEASFAQYRPQFLDTFARQQAVLQLAEKGGITSDDAAIDAQIAADRAQFQSDDEFNSALQGSGFADEDDYRLSLQQQQIASAYLKQLSDRFTFSDAVVATFYNLNKASFTREAQACVRHILVPTEAEAQQIVKDLAAGGDFAAIAKAQSKDPGSAEQGGDLGCIAPGDTVPEFDKAAFEGPLNTVQTVKTQFGYHVLQVTKRTDAGLAPLAEVQGQIRDQLAAQAAQKYLDAQVARLKVTVYADRLPVVAAPDDQASPEDQAAPDDAAPSDDAPTDTAPTDAPPSK
ncbi:peptidylprolyl isomerase [Deinococcus irradiatisoli]|uniref:Peptidylprolyl isomerase n=1 Tax=Deinococcus irradiatisoli TaxID=2202254 RepID=A0A2Z3JDD8_9DEIO|nr:peptidylprolyl isomerase [Deinococcus irradiatisoli]AWN23193.1 peptidylprolyl isomerase [Deinococcus irradiatisoli]